MHYPFCREVFFIIVLHGKPPKINYNTHAAHTDWYTTSAYKHPALASHHGRHNPHHSDTSKHHLRCGNNGKDTSENKRGVHTEACVHVHGDTLTNCTWGICTVHALSYVFHATTAERHSATAFYQRHHNKSHPGEEVNEGFPILLALWSQLMTICVCLRVCVCFAKTGAPQQT